MHVLDWALGWIWPGFGLGGTKGRDGCLIIPLLSFDVLAGQVGRGIRGEGLSVICV